MKLRTSLVIVIAAILTAAIIAGSTLLMAYALTGKTPEQFLSYAMRRLEGHPKLEAVFYWVLDHVTPGRKD